MSGMDMGKWKGLFEWSMKYQDGTRPTEHSELTPEKKEWLEHALQDFMKDFADRMKEINKALSTEEQQAPGTADAQPQAAAGAGNAAAASAGSDTTAGLSLSEKEALCDELMDIVESVDHARDLHKIGGLPTLLSLMSSVHPSLRWRAAEITATCMANNPPVQRWFMEGGALPHLLGLLSDSNVVVATKAVLALSALVRHYDPGLEAFRLAGGLQKLLALLGCSTDAAVPATAAASTPVEQQQEGADAAGTEGEEGKQQQQQRLKRKVVALLQYVLLKHPADRLAAAEFGAAGQLRLLLSDTDSDMRQAVLSVLAELCSTPQSWDWVHQHEHGLVQQLQQLQQQHSQLGQEDQEAEAEEGQLLQQLLTVLQAGHAPAGLKAGALEDHVELDPYQDGGERAEKTLNIRQPEEQQQQQPGSSTGDGNGLSLMAVPKPELR